MNEGIARSLTDFTIIQCWRCRINNGRTLRWNLERDLSKKGVNETETRGTEREGNYILRDEIFTRRLNEPVKPSSICRTETVQSNFKSPQSMLRNQVTPGKLKGENLLSSARQKSTRSTWRTLDSAITKPTVVWSNTIVGWSTWISSGTTIVGITAGWVRRISLHVNLANEWPTFGCPDNLSLDCSLLVSHHCCMLLW